MQDLYESKALIHRFTATSLTKTYIQTLHDRHVDTQKQTELSSNRAHQIKVQRNTSNVFQERLPKSVHRYLHIKTISMHHTILFMKDSFSPHV